MCTTPSAPPEIALFTEAESEPLRPLSTRRSIGNETPETPSTCPSSSKREITDQTGFDVPGMFMDALEKKLQ